MQAHTHTTASRLSRVRVDVVAVTPLAVNVGTHTHTHATACRLSGVRVDVVVVPPLAVNSGTHTPPPLVFPESGVRSERNTLKPSRLTQESGHESDSQVSVMHTIPASMY